MKRPGRTNSELTVTCQETARNGSRRKPFPWRTCVLAVAAVLFLISGMRGKAVEVRGSEHSQPGGASIAQLMSPLPFDQGLVLRVDKLPRGATYISMRRMQFDPDAALAALPIDGPMLIVVEAGRVSIELSRGGAIAYRGAGTAASEPLAPNEVHALDAGDLALIPAGIPLRFANGEPSPARWIQFQAETPATECPCGADLTGIRSELLDSVTVETPLAVPAEIEFSIGQLEPGSSRERRPGTAVVLIGPGDHRGEGLSREPDGSIINRGAAPLVVYTMTLRPAGATT